MKDTIKENIADQAVIDVIVCAHYSGIFAISAIARKHAARKREHTLGPWERVRFLEKRQRARYLASLPTAAPSDEHVALQVKQRCVSDVRNSQAYE